MIITSRVIFPSGMLERRLMIFLLALMKMVRICKGSLIVYGVYRNSKNICYFNIIFRYLLGILSDDLSSSHFTLALLPFLWEMTVLPYEEFACCPTKRSFG